MISQSDDSSLPRLAETLLAHRDIGVEVVTSVANKMKIKKKKKKERKKENTTKHGLLTFSLFFVLPPVPPTICCLLSRCGDGYASARSTPTASHASSPSCPLCARQRPSPTASSQRLRRCCRRSRPRQRATAWSAAGSPTSTRRPSSCSNRTWPKGKKKEQAAPKNKITILIIILIVIINHEIL
jgi:hypothetical protein